MTPCVSDNVESLSACHVVVDVSALTSHAISHLQFTQNMTA